MEHPQNAQVFGALLFPQSSNVESALHKVTTYIDKSKMCQHKTWGTEKEITVASTLFQVDILIFSTLGRGRKWLCFSLAFCNHACTLKPSRIKLHLYHTKCLDHYHRVVPKLCTLNIVGGEPPRCNCGSCGAHHKSSCPLNPRCSRK